ncbi:BrnA antitoxin family protein [Undibacterium seohonense]|jgi:predicted DNA binding CopG/RHH family protein|nr:BrnA antitoxin family protein [Undibacterium seohonense]
MTLTSIDLLVLPSVPWRSNETLLTEGEIMRDEYDSSKASKNPYVSQLKKKITIRLDEESINYFKSIAEGIGIPYQSRINLYLHDCATSHRKLSLRWK